jgi:hypothetical protein
MLLIEALIFFDTRRNVSDWWKTKKYLKYRNDTLVLGSGKRDQIVSATKILLDQIEE